MYTQHISQVMCMTKCFLTIMDHNNHPSLLCQQQKNGITHPCGIILQWSNDAMNYTRQIMSEYNYAHTHSIEQCYEWCLNYARMILGKSSVNTIMHLQTLSTNVMNDAMNNARTMLEWFWANPQWIQLCTYGLYGMVLWTKLWMMLEQCWANPQWLQLCTYGLYGMMLEWC